MLALTWLSVLISLPVMDPFARVPHYCLVEDLSMRPILRTGLVHPGFFRIPSLPKIHRRPVHRTALPLPKTAPAAGATGWRKRRAAITAPDGREGTNLLATIHQIVRYLNLRELSPKPNGIPLQRVSVSGQKDPQRSAPVRGAAWRRALGVPVVRLFIGELTYSLDQPHHPLHTPERSEC